MGRLETRHQCIARVHMRSRALSSWARVRFAVVHDPFLGVPMPAKGFPCLPQSDNDQRNSRGRSASKHTDITVRMTRYLTGTFRTDSWLRLTAAIGFGQRSNVAFEALPG
jgi:hypothetical protein